LILPTTELQLPLVRIFSSGGSNLLGTGIPTVSVTAALLGGFFAQPFRVPEDYDRTREGRLYVVITNANAVGPAAGNVQLETVRGIAGGGIAPTDVTFTTVQAIPAAWPANAWIQLEVGSAAAPFIPGGTLSQFGLVGIRPARNGPAAGDTWGATLSLFTTVILRYHRLCLHCCGC